MTRAPGSAPATPWPRIGRIVPGYAVPVINEREARAAAGLLFLPGIVLYLTAIHAGTAQPLKPFGAVFVLDMLIRVLVGDRYAPSLALARIIVSRQQPEWVGAPQKLFAWWLGYGMGLLACLATGLLQAPLWVTLVLCGICLTMLFLETAFGICVGCRLQSLLTKTPPKYCAGGTCEIPDDIAPASTLTTLPQHPTAR
ncbi:MULTISPECIES: DUF4395 domain-containing protein [Leucobacter]|uniref:Uncharacterized protein DUF4395 n=2 Tax=Leucobacter TaxID=55968 RepID=A0A4Q7U464_9MICO|nr:DUF4395 domain-containing protein [Leucobacter luti]MBL3691085.1 DUF4395 domain-containing protein [Leucobacter chromiireducens subsp. chromiireducens]MBL3700838.1 DUF4395 domain-containing protein [Leucobacter luti]RZT68323.1 uncharacterized protein DUF4395 [Leucobacter luti]